LVISAFLLVACHALLITAFAQSASATLSGTVEDTNGAVIPGVTITVTNNATGAQRQTTTNKEGYFVVSLLPPSRYQITAQNQGFTTVRIPEVVLNVGDQKALQIQLKAGDVNATVQVTNDADLIRTDAAVSTVVDRQFVANIPLNGRSFQSLIALTPGVVRTKANASDEGQFSVNGQRADANYFTVDGVSANFSAGTQFQTTQSGGGSLPSLSASGGTNSLVSVDGLQEFKIQTSTYAPEFGRSPGGQVQIVTRSGTNALTGTLFEYFRNDALDANDWFANQNGLPKPALRQNDFGGVLGGPILKDRTFFFFSYEGLRLRLPQIAITNVPTLTARRGAVAAIQPLLNAYPIPNGRDLGNGLAEFSASYSDPSTLNATSIRLDHSLNKKLTIFGRYNHAPSELMRRLGDGVNFSLSSVTRTRFRTQTVTFGTTWSISSATSNDLRANYSKSINSSFNLLDSFGGAVPPPDSLLFPSSFSRNNALFGLFLGVGTSTALQVGENQENIQRQINLVDNLSIVTGSHQLKMGVDYRYLFPTFGPRQYIDNYSFNDVPQLMTGQAGFAVVGAGEIVDMSVKNFSAFGQDTWRVTPRLTLTYGMRWELDPSPSSRNGKQLLTVQGLDNPSALTLAPPGTRFYRTTYDNFAPRIGVAYQLSQKQRRETVLRGGFGIFYDLGTGTILNSSSLFPFNRSKSLFNVQFPIVTDPVLSAPPPLSTTPPVNSIAVTDPKLKSPRTYQWNVAIEQALGSKQTVSASYVGAAGRRLLRFEVLRRPNGSFNLVQVTRNTATSDYNALQLQYTRRLSRGLQALASYTWSHSIDTASNDSLNFAAAAFINPNVDRASSDFDVRHSFTGAVTYDIPVPGGGKVKALLRNWTIDGILTARSATPVDLVGGRNVVGFVANFRPDLIPNAPLYISDQTVPGGRRFNIAAFAAPAAGRQGTLGRNVLRSFPAWQADIALRRRFSLTERLKLQLGAEFFNVFNHPNFGDPANDIRIPSAFGRSTQMLGRNLSSFGSGFTPLYQIGGPRSIQLSLKMTF